jgi:hypothetical protein
VTFSLRPIVCESSFLPLNWKADVRPVTRRFGIFAGAFSPNCSIRCRNRLNPRAVIPRISAARSQLYSLFIARSSTSLICIARSTAEGGMSIGASHHAFYPSPPPARKVDISLAQKSGQIMCSLQCALYTLTPH